MLALKNFLINAKSVFLPKKYKFDFRSAIYGTLLSVIILSLLGWFASVFSPHPDVYVTFNRIYSVNDGSFSFDDISHVAVASTNGTDNVFLLKNIQGKRTIALVHFLPYCCKLNETYGSITISNFGRGIANNIEIIGLYDTPMVIIGSPSNVGIQTPIGPSNGHTLKINSLDANSTIYLWLKSDHVPNATIHAYLDDVKLADEKVSVFDSVILPFLPEMEFSDCKINIPKVSSEYGRNAFLLLVFSDKSRCKYSWKEIDFSNGSIKWMTSED